MNRNLVIAEFEKSFLHTQRPKFNIGDTVKVHLKIKVEDDTRGKSKKDVKERVQAFQGTVIAKKGSGLSETFTVYRNAYGSSMQRVFLMNSPKIGQIEILRSGKVRRAKLNYLKGRSGKKAKLKEKLFIFKPGSKGAALEKDALTQVAETIKAEKEKVQVTSSEKVIEKVVTQAPAAVEPKKEAKAPVKKVEEKVEKKAPVVEEKSSEEKPKE